MTWLLVGQPYFTKKAKVPQLGHIPLSAPPTQGSSQGWACPLPGKCSRGRAQGHWWGGPVVPEPNLLVPVLHQSDQTLQLGGARDDEVPLQLCEARGVFARIVEAVDEVHVDLRAGPGAGDQLAWKQRQGQPHFISQSQSGANESTSEISYLGISLWVVWEPPARPRGALRWSTNVA